MILLVVNHEATHTALVPLIEAKGFKAFPAQCGEEALHCVRTFRPRLIILDCGLPDSFEIMSAIRKEKPGQHTPIVMFSRGDPEIRQKALQSGADGFVAKGSLDWANLLDEIVRFVGPPGIS
jgi:DNA-binding response OmpR family regulator